MSPPDQMEAQSYSLCIRCGKARIFLRRWKDKENTKGPPIVHEETVCPDAECQKIVDQKFQEMRDRRRLSEERKINLHLNPKIQAKQAS